MRNIPLSGTNVNAYPVRYTWARPVHKGIWTRQAQAHMSQFRIIGGTPLAGTIHAGGSKNAALPMMAASILAAEPVRLEGVPRVADVDTLSMVLCQLGVEVTRTDKDGVLLETVDPTPARAGYELVRRMRASFCVLGPLLARRGMAVVSLPGGCNIGPRPVDATSGPGRSTSIFRGWLPWGPN